MTAAVGNGATIAVSEKTIVVRGNHYFPVHMEFLRPSSTTNRCPWQETAKYYSVMDGEANEDAGWYSPEPSKVAFWNGVDVR